MAVELIEHQFADSRAEIARIRQGQLSLGFSPDLIAAVGPTAEKNARSRGTALGSVQTARSSMAIVSRSWTTSTSIKYLAISRSSRACEPDGLSTTTGPQ